MLNKQLLVIGLVIAGAFGLGIGNVGAASNSNTIGVSPALQTLVARSGQRMISYDVTLTNTSTSPQIVSISAADFTAFAGTGQVQFLDPAKPNKDHGLLDSFQLLSPQILINPGESRAIPVTLNNVDKLTPGGHYGAILLKTSKPNSLVKNNISITQTVASLVFLTTEGKGSYGLNLQPIRTTFGWFRLPSTLNLAFKNTGNVQVVPRGYINITSPFGRPVSKTVLNTDSGLVLPGTTRLLQTPVKTTGRAIIPGIYNIKVYYKYDGAKTYSVQSSKVVFLNLWLVGGLIILIGLTVFAAIHFDLVYRTQKFVQKVIHRK